MVHKKTYLMQTLLYVNIFKTKKREYQRELYDVLCLNQAIQYFFNKHDFKGKEEQYNYKL